MLKLLLRLSPLMALMGWSVYYYLDTCAQDPEAGYLVKPVFYVIAVLFFVILRGELKRWKAESKEGESRLSEKDLLRLKKVLCCVAGGAVYLALMPYAGFLISTFLFLSAGFIALKADKKQAVLVSLFLSLAVYGVFKYLLGVPLFSGPLGF